MVTKKIRYFVEKPGRLGPRYFWQPSQVLRDLGWHGQRLKVDRQAAIAQAERINADLDAWRPGQGYPHRRQGKRNRPAGLPSDAPAQGVYVIGFANGPVKIGITKDPHFRLQQLQTGSSQRLSLCLYLYFHARDGYVIEGLVHRALAAFRREGEWFSVSSHKAMAAVLSVVLRAVRDDHVPTTETHQETSV